MLTLSDSFRIIGLQHCTVQLVCNLVHGLNSWVSGVLASYLRFFVYCCYFLCIALFIGVLFRCCFASLLVIVCKLLDVSLFLRVACAYATAVSFLVFFILLRHIVTSALGGKRRLEVEHTEHKKISTGTPYDIFLVYCLHPGETCVCMSAHYACSTADNRRYHCSWPLLSQSSSTHHLGWRFEFGYLLLSLLFNIVPVVVLGPSPSWYPTLISNHNWLHFRPEQGITYTAPATLRFSHPSSPIPFSRGYFFWEM